MYIALGSMDVFTIFSPMRTGYLSIDLCLFSFFHQCLMFSVCRSFKSLVKFIPSFLGDEIINGIVFLVPLSDSSLLVYRITNDPAVLLNSFF